MQEFPLMNGTVQLGRRAVLARDGAGTSPTGATTPGDPYAGFETSFSRLPVPGTTARFFYLAPDGGLGARPPAAQGVNAYTSNPSALPLTDFTGSTGGGGLWGNGAVHVWVRSSTPDVD